MITKEEFKATFPTSQFGKYCQEKLTRRLLELRSRVDTVSHDDLDNVQGQIAAILVIADAFYLNVKPELMLADASTSEEHS